MMPSTIPLSTASESSADSWSLNHHDQHTPPQQPPQHEKSKYSNGTQKFSTTDNNINLLSKIVDVSVVDTYLLQTYIVPTIIDILQPPTEIVSRLLSQLLPSPSPLSHNNEFNDHQNHYDTTICDRIMPRIVKCMVPFFTVMGTRGMTPGMRQMNVQFISTSSTRTTASANTRVRKLQNQLLFYCILQYLIPELLYPLLRYYTQSMMEYRSQILQKRSPTLSSSCSSRKSENCHDDTTNLNPLLLLQPQSSQQRQQVSMIRQYQLLQHIQSILDGIDTKVIPLLQFVTLLLCWSGTTKTNHLSMILAGLQYTNTTTPDSSPLQSSSVSSQPILFYLAMAHRRWLTHHIWETIRTIVLPSLTAIRNIVRESSHPRPEHHFVLFVILQRMQRMAIHFRTYIQRFVVSTIVPQQVPSIQTPMNKKSPTNHNTPNNDHNDVCPFCQQFPPTVAVQGRCQKCNIQQIYCYACFYQNYGINQNQPHHVVEEENRNLRARDSISSPYDASTASVTTTTTRTEHLHTDVAYRIPIMPQQISRSLPHCRQCQTTIDTVKFVHLKQ